MYTLEQPVPDRHFELVTLSFFHRRMHLARRMLDTLYASACPAATLHILLADRDPRLFGMLKSVRPPSGRTLCLCRHEGTIHGNPYANHVNWIMKQMEGLSFDHLAIVDSDFELHSGWYRQIQALMAGIPEKERVRGYTAFNNATGDAGRHATVRIHPLPPGGWYGLKRNCGSGHLVLSKTAAYALGPMDTEHQDITWLLKLQAEEAWIATTIPSFVQHLGAATSQLGHLHDVTDFALDFQGDYAVFPWLSGAWRNPATGPLFIHRNGLITSARQTLLENIIGHVSVTSPNDFELVFADRSVLFRGSHEDHNTGTLKSLDGQFALTRME